MNNNNNNPVVSFEFATASRTVFEVDAFETRAVRLIADVAKQEGAQDVLDGKHPVLLVSGTSSRFSTELARKLRDEANVESVEYHCPKGEPTVESIIECTKRAAEKECELVVAIGGGTAVDTGKCVAAMLTNGAEKRRTTFSKLSESDADRKETETVRGHTDDGWTRGRVDKK